METYVIKASVAKISNIGLARDVFAQFQTMAATAKFIHKWLFGKLPIAGTNVKSVS